MSPSHANTFARLPACETIGECVVPFALSFGFVCALVYALFPAFCRRHRKTIGAAGVAAVIILSIELLVYGAYAVKALGLALGALAVNVVSKSTKPLSRSIRV
jgi:hypothetical protein